MDKNNKENSKEKNTPSPNHEVEGEHANDVFVFDEDITNENVDKAIFAIKQNPAKSPRLTLILHTLGGDAHAAYRLARAFTKNYEQWAAFVPKISKSAGTLVCLAANEIIMSDFSELGPLDIQVMKKDEFAVLGSGLDYSSAFRQLRIQTFLAFKEYFIGFQKGTGITARIAADVAAKLAGNTMAPIFKKIDPLIIGEVARSLEIAVQYGHRMKSDNVRENAIFELANMYCSHEFVIDFDEAKHLFHKVRPPLPEEEAYLNEISHKIGYVLPKEASDDRAATDFQGRDPAKNAGVPATVPEETGPDVGE